MPKKLKMVVTVFIFTISAIVFQSSSFKVSFQKCVLIKNLIVNMPTSNIFHENPS
jgi:hypothetical protein